MSDHAIKVLIVLAATVVILFMGYCSVCEDKKDRRVNDQRHS